MLLTWCLPVFIPCANDSNQLIELFMEYDKVKIPEDILEKMTNLCQNVTACFNSECSTSQDYKQFYNAKCQNLEFQKTDLHECLSRVYYLMYNGHYNCIEQYNFLSTDLKLKQDSFNSGKFCIIQIVINQCSSESAEFVNTNYEKLVNMLTVKPDGETCAEPFHEFHSQQCLAAVNRAKFKIQEVFGDEQPSFFDERWPQIYDICEKAKECINNCCQYDDRDRQTIENLCNSFQISSSKLGECLRKLSQEKTDLTKYSCLNGTELFGKELMEPCRLFGTIKECKKTVLEEFCGSKVIEANEKIIESLLSLNGCG